jgi:myo-inositol 2-dehydrogenase / D-chiro-inositol 1-dehydrogenase
MRRGVPHLRVSGKGEKTRYLPRHPGTNELIHDSPAPPTIEFVRRSGGMFRDMMIHDLDIACWLMAEEPIELFATASVMVDPAIGEAGDVDTAVVTLRMKSGALCQIANTRRAVYGYDRLQALALPNQANRLSTSRADKTRQTGTGSANPFSS